MYDLDFDHQFIETEKYDTKMTYKKFTGRIKALVFKFVSVPAKLQRQENRQIGHLTAKLARRTICCGF